ncbi:MAG TPA: dihydrofolate reductase [Bacteroidia bacterium]
MMTLSIIVAVSENDVIGKDNSLVWHLPADMKFFKDKTSGHAIITGRKNYESIPVKYRPLVNRTNIVVTRQLCYKAPGATVVSSIEEAFKYVKQHHPNEEVFIIGGAEIFEQTIALCQKVYLTRVHHSFEGDVFFPELPLANWKLINQVDVPADEKNSRAKRIHEYKNITTEKTNKYHFTFETWERKATSINTVNSQ